MGLVEISGLSRAALPTGCTPAIDPPYAIWLLMAMSEKLDAGAVFPNMTLNLSAGGSLALPDDLDPNYTILLFYRGHW